MVRRCTRCLLDQVVRHLHIRHCIGRAPRGSSFARLTSYDQYSDGHHVGFCNNHGVPDAGLHPAVMERFRSGDDDAVRSLYQQYGRLVFTIAIRILGDRQLAEDATQQAFLQAWRAASSFDLTRDPAPWLATITRRVAIDMQRSEARRPGHFVGGHQRRRTGIGQPSAISGRGLGDLAGARCDRRPPARRTRSGTAATHRGSQPERDCDTAGTGPGYGQVAFVPGSPAPGEPTETSSRTD